MQSPLPLDFHRVHFVMLTFSLCNVNGVHFAVDPFSFRHIHAIQLVVFAVVFRPQNDAAPDAIHLS